MTEAAPAHARSEGAVNPALRVFKVPPTDISINAYRMVTIQPTTTGINPMEFIVPALDDYVDLGRSYFTVELRLKKSTNDDLIANEKLWPVNNLAHSIIKQIDLQLNGILNGAELCCTTSISIKEKKKMEQVVLNNVKLDYLARDDPSIETLFLWDSGL